MRPYNDIQVMLDGMLSDDTYQDKCTQANSKIEKRGDDVILLELVDAMERENIITEELIAHSLKVVADILKKIKYNAHIQRTKKGATINHDVMPMLIKQVLFYISCQGMVADNIKSLDWSMYIKEQMKKQGVYISKNLFSNRWYTPSYYVASQTNNIVDNPCKYKGQKSGELAFAINNLIYQAQRHDCVVDLFGGSGSAISAVSKRKKCGYYYNELNRCVYNYFAVMKSTRYKKVIKLIREVQYDIYAEGFRFSKKFKIEPMKDLQDYWERMPNDTNARDMEKKIACIAGYKINPRDVKRMCECYTNDVSYLKDDTNIFWDISCDRIFDLLVAKGKIPAGFKEKFDFNELVNYLATNSFHKCEELLFLLSLHGVHSSKYSKIRVQYSDNDGENHEVRYSDWRILLRQYKALIYFAYFDNLRNRRGVISDSDKEIYAVGEIFLRFVNTRNDIISSAIIHDRGALARFLNTDFDLLIERFHESIRQVRCSNESFEKILDKFSDKNPIFYVDPPYVATSDYKDEVNGITGGNGTQLTTRLLNKLNACRGKYILSMRAAISLEKSSNNARRVASRNSIIDKFIYRELEKSTAKLYVLVICDEGKELRDLLANNRVVEVMITNFPIRSFGYTCNSKNYSYVVYSLSDYLEVVRGSWRSCSYLTE